MQDFKYIKNISGDEATMLIYKEIGDSVDEFGNMTYGINGSSFANEMQWLETQCKTINVRINSVGGNVFDGYSIVSAILHSKCKVNTYVDGVAASTAGWIAVAGNKCYMADYGTFMMHNPTGGDKKVLSMIKDTIVTILSNRTKLSKEEVDDMMSVETWISAEDCLKKGIVDELIKTNKKVKVSNDLKQAFAIYNKLITNKMEKVTNVLKLQSDASEDSIVSAIDVLNKENETLKNEKQALEQRISDLVAKNEAKELEAKEALKNKVIAFVNKMEVEGKITKDEVEKTIEFASKDEASFEVVSNLLSKAVNNKTSVKVFDFTKIPVKNGVEDRSTWTYNDWETKDVKGLTNLYKENPEMFNELLKTRKINK